MSLGEQTYYELLEIGPRATREEIQVAYNRARAAFSQNSLAVYSLFSPEECQALQQQIEEAYRTLMNEDARRRYDESIGLTPAAAVRPAREPWPRHGEAPAGPVGSPVGAADGGRPPGTPPWLRPGQPAATQGAAAAPSPRPVPPPSRTGPVSPHAAAAPLRPAPVPPAAEPLIGEGTVITGALLRKVRESRGLRLRDIAETTKVSVTYLEFIEEENFRQLPVPAYLRGFLKAYARCVGLDPDRVSAEYLKLYALYHEIKGER